LLLLAITLSPLEALVLHPFKLLPSTSNHKQLPIMVLQERCTNVLA
jgi:hypothetical protein